MGLMLSTMPQLSIMPQLSTTPLLSTLPQLMLPSTLPQLMLNQLMLMNPTPTSTELLMTTPRLTSTLLRPLMVPVLSLDLMMLLFPMAVPSMSSTPPTTTTDMSLMSPMTESQSTPRPSLMSLLPPLPTMLKPSLCFVNIYQNIY